MRRKTCPCIQRRLGAVFIWRWLLSAMQVEHCRALFLKAKPNVLFLCRWSSFPCTWHPFVFLKCLGDAFCLFTGCLEWPYYFRLPLPPFSFYFVLLIDLLLTSHSLFIPSLFVSYALSILPFFVTLLAIGVWQKKCLKKRKWTKKSQRQTNKKPHKTKNPTHKPDPGNLSTREQTRFSTVVLSMFLKSYNCFFSAWLRFSLFWARSWGCTSFVLMQYLSIWGHASFWVSSVGFYCCACYYTN